MQLLIQGISSVEVEAIRRGGTDANGQRAITRIASEGLDASPLRVQTSGELHFREPPIRSHP